MIILECNVRDGVTHEREKPRATIFGDVIEFGGAGGLVKGASEQATFMREMMLTEIGKIS